MPAADGPDVFISYRHADSRQIVDRMQDYLVKDLGPGHVFRDVEGIDGGASSTRESTRQLRAPR